MDQMIHHLNKLMGKNPMNEDQIRQCVAYLNNKASLEYIKPFLPTNDRNYYYGSIECSEIAAGVAADTTLLPRLGSYLKLLQAIGPSTLENFIKNLLNTLSEEQIFLESSFGENELLKHIFNGRVCNTHHKELLSLVYKQSPAVFHRFAESEQRAEPLAWLCAHNGWELFSGARKQGLIGKLLNRDDSQKCSDSLAEFISALMLAIHSKSGTLDALYAVLDAEMPEAATALRKASKHPAASAETAADNGHKASSVLMRSLLLTDYKLESLNKLMQISCRVNCTGFIDSFSDVAWTRSGNILRNQWQYRNSSRDEKTTEAIQNQLEPIRNMLKLIGIDDIYLCMWIVQQTIYYPNWYEDIFNDEFAENLDLLRRCAAFAPAMIKAYLCRILQKHGDALPESLAGECIDIFYTHPETDSKQRVDKVAPWLKTGKGECPDEALKQLSINLRNNYTTHACDVDFALCCLIGLDPAAKRYYKYLIATESRDCVLLAAAFVQTNLDISAEDFATFILECGDAEKVLSIIAPESSNVSAERRRFMKAAIGSVPDFAAAAITKAKGSVDGRVAVLELLYEAIPDYDYDFLISCLSDKSKKISGYALSLLLPHKELAEKVRPLLDAKKQTVRDFAQTLMAAYEDSSASTETGDILGLCTRSMPRNPAQAVKWVLPNGDFPQVRWADRDEAADEIVSKCYLALMLSAKTVDLPPVAAKIRPFLNADDLHEIACNVYSSWIADGAATKFRAALLIYGVHASDSDVLVLQRQINDWAEHSRGAIAADAVRAVAMGGSDLALLTVDNMSRKFKNKQVRRAAGEALDAAAAAIGITTEELGDRIIPTLGFDERGERVVDYGTRTFTATISPSLAIVLTDDNGKVIKALPKPGAKDDTEKAERAKTEFAALKKSLKAVVQTQQQRLEQALATSRQWTPDAWKKLFVQNPIMHSFAIGLVWGVYKENELLQSFRYMEDGGFTDVNEDDFDFAAAQGSIGLVHPLDLSDADLAAWKQQLEDYEVAQPVVQIGRPVYLIAEEEKAKFALSRFGGLEMLAITLSNKLQKSGWYRGSVQDGGAFYTFYREIGEVGIELTFSGCYVSPDPTEGITVGQLVFYKAGTVQRGSYVYDEVKLENAISLADASPRLFSEIVYDVTNATATSTGKNERWQKDNGLVYFGGK